MAAQAAPPPPPADGAVLRLAAAADALYGTRVASSRQEMEAANVWLMAFSESAEAWGVCLALLAAAGGKEGGQGISQEARFLASSILVLKVRKEAARLSVEEVAEVARVVWEVLDRMVVEEKSQLQQAKEASVVKRKLAECAGAAAVRCPVESGVGVKGVIARMQHWALGDESYGAMTAVLVATAMAEELDKVIGERRKHLLDSLLDSGAHWVVFAVVERMLIKGDAQEIEKGLRCIEMWHKLDARGDGGVLIRTSKIRERLPQLWAALPQVPLAYPEEDELCAAWVDAVGELLRPAGASDGAAAPDYELIEALALAASRTHPPHQAFVLAASSIASNTPEWLAAGSPSALSLISVVLNSFRTITAEVQTSGEWDEAHNARSVEAILEVFLSLNTTSKSERHPSLQSEVYMEVLTVLLQTCMIPSMIQTVKSPFDDEDFGGLAFFKFRERVMAELVECCFSVLGSSMVISLAETVHSCNSSGNKSGVEAALFCFSCISTLVRPMLKTSLAKSSEQERVIAGCQQCLALIMDDSGKNMLADSFVAKTAVTTVGQHAGFWKDKQAAQVAMKFLISSFKVPSAWLEAARAFRLLSAVKPNLDHLEIQDIGVAACSGMPSLCLTGEEEYDSREIEAQTTVVEGLARMISSLDAEKACQVSTFIASPLVERLGAFQCFSSSQGSPVIKQIEVHIRLLASLVRFLEFDYKFFQDKPHQKHPAMNVTEMAWPIIRDILENEDWGWLRSTDDVTAALAEFFCRLLLTVKSSAIAGILGEVLPKILGGGKEILNPSVFDFLGCISEILGESSLINLPAALQTIFTAAFKNDGLAMRADPEIKKGLLDMCHRLLLFTPSLLISPKQDAGLLDSLLSICVSVFQEQEMLALSSACSLVSLLTAPPRNSLTDTVVSSSKDLICATVNKYGERMLGGILLSLVNDGSQGRTVRAMSGLLFGVLTFMPRNVTEEWLYRAIQSDEFRRVNVNMQEKDFIRAVQIGIEILISSMPDALKRRKFDVLIKDLSEVCGGKADPDVLIAHQLS